MNLTLTSIYKFLGVIWDTTEKPVNLVSSLQPVFMELVTQLFNAIATLAGKEEIAELPAAVLVAIQTLVSVTDLIHAYVSLVVVCKDLIVLNV